MADDAVELIGLPELRKRFGALELEVMPKAASRAANRTAKTVRTRNARLVAQIMGSRVTSVKRRYKIDKATKTRPTATIRIRGDKINLAGFSARQTKQGVSASAWGSRKIYGGTFLVRIDGNRLAMKRETRGGKRVGRMPIRAVHGPGVTSTATSDEAKKDREEIVDERYPIELESALEFYLRRFKS